jgi:hypothetical protein
VVHYTNATPKNEDLLVLYAMMSCSSKRVVGGGDGPCRWVLSVGLTPVE